MPAPQVSCVHRGRMTQHRAEKLQQLPGWVWYTRKPGWKWRDSVRALLCPHTRRRTHTHVHMRTHTCMRAHPHPHTRAHMCMRTPPHAQTHAYAQRVREQAQSKFRIRLHVRPHI